MRFSAAGTKHVDLPIRNCCLCFTCYMIRDQVCFITEKKLRTLIPDEGSQFFLLFLFRI